jgi:hypothetical protein
VPKHKGIEMGMGIRRGHGQRQGLFCFREIVIVSGGIAPETKGVCGGLQLGHPLVSGGITTRD